MDDSAPSSEAASNSEADTKSVHAISGELTFDSVPALCEQPLPWGAAGTTLTIDLKQVSRTDSAGLALLLSWMREAKRHDTRVTFRNLPAQLRAIAGPSRLEELLPTSDA